MASPAGRLYSAASAGNMDNVIQRKGVNTGILSRKPLLDRPVNSKSPSLTRSMNKTGSFGKQNTNKLSFPSMTKQFAQVNLTVEEEDLDAEEFMFSFEEVEDELWRADVDDMVNALELLKLNFCNLETPPPSPPPDMKLKQRYIDFDSDLERRYVRCEENNNVSFDVSFDVDFPQISDDSDPECDRII